MEQDIKVSVICMVFNHGPYIRDALEGFVAQKTNFAFEVLVHDDASTDNSADIIREYEQKYPEIIKPIYQKQNQHSQGVSIRGILTPRVKGKYTALCEGDDYWTDPLKLQKQYDFLEANPEYSLCAGSTVWLNLKTGIRNTRRPFPEDADVSLEDIILHQPGRYFHTSTMFVKTEIYKETPEWRRKFPIGDYPLAILAALNGKVRMLVDEMSVYRYYAVSSWTVRMDNDENRARISLRMINALEALDEDTEFCHSAVIRERMLKHKYTYALMTHDIKMLRSDELKPIFRSRSALLRFSDVLRCKNPKFFAKVIKPMAKVIKSIYGE